MKIAIASDNNMVSGHFGHCEGFIMYEVKGDKINNKDFVENPGHRPGYLPEFLKEQSVNVIIAGGMGETAQKLFKNNNIDVIVGAGGRCDDVVKQYINASLKSTGSVCKEHMHEGHCNS